MGYTWTLWLAPCKSPCSYTGPQPLASFWLRGVKAGVVVLSRGLGHLSIVPKNKYLVAVAQLVRVPDCGSGCRGFKSPQPPLIKPCVAKSYARLFLWPDGGDRVRCYAGAMFARISAGPARNRPGASGPVVIAPWHPM